MLLINTNSTILEEAARFYADALGIAHLPGEIDICWLVGEDSDVTGGCADLGNGCYEIGVSKNPEDTLMALAHEFVHVYQYLTGALRDIDRNSVIYLDKVYNVARLSYVEYRALPFEIEAFDKQLSLCTAFIKWHFLDGNSYER